MERFSQVICCQSRRKYPDPYNFNFNANHIVQVNQTNFQSNYVKTSKYTWYNFLPKALLLQFKRLANIYFLFNAILQSIPLISPLTPITAWIPLTVVLSISMLREGYEDYQRYKSDQQMNHQLKTFVRRNGQFQEVEWSQVVMGDICCVKQDELIPADLVLLASSNPSGIAFIQTASLDGQKNLKPRAAKKQTQVLDIEENLKNFKGAWKGIIPDKQLHKFSSDLQVNDQKIVYQGDKQLLYRGSKLRNTKWVYGLVIYTGQNTKILMNSQLSGQKMSQIEIKVNKILIFIFLFQLFLCLISTLFFSVHLRKKGHEIYNISRSSYPLPLDSIVMFFSYFILINSMIPISLIVSLEFVKLFQSYFINKDNLMFSQLRQKSVSVKTTSLNQELGQIEYVFTDKTGTLTMNSMQFKIAVIGNKLYGDYGDNQLERASSKFNDIELKDLVEDGDGDFQLENQIKVGKQNQYNIKTQRDLAEQYLLALSTAHEVVVEKEIKQDKEIFKYQGPSPDEITFVQAAKNMGYEFICSNQSTTTVKIGQIQKTFQLLQVFPFTSDRKRMSVIIEDKGVIKMYCKGADNIIKKRLSTQSNLNLDPYLDKFSKEGLRTLLIAMRVISNQQYKEFRSKVQTLPQGNSRQRLYEQLVSKLEEGLYLLGATAVLDRLQDFVPETIRDLIRAHIKVWMLTGDKLETAQNIAKSCNLFQREFSILKLRNSGNINQQFQKLAQKSLSLHEKHQKNALIIEGSDLAEIFKTQQGKADLIKVAQNCDAVVCCRLLPLQKAQVVNLVKNKLKKITLAIGDGANDVPMIKAAHIGVGLFGEQGMNAVQACDYALPQFRMLWRLLFVHGRWNYIRISEMVLYFFFKNMLFTFPQFVSGFYTGFSGQSIYDDWYITLYNLVFTSIPVVVRAVLEQDVNYVIQKNQESQQSGQELKKKIKKQALIQNEQKYLPKGYSINRIIFNLFPKIYFIGRQNCIFNYRNFFFWAIEAIIEGTVTIIFCFSILGEISINQLGLNNSLWLVGMTMYSAIICIVTFKICTHTKHFSKLFLFSVLFLSVFLYLSYMWITNYSITNNIYGTTIVAWTCPKTYLTVFFCIFAILFIDGIITHIDFEKGGYTSKMRKMISENQIESNKLTELLSVRLSEQVSEMGKLNKNFSPKSFEV